MDVKALFAAPLVAFLVVASANEVAMPQGWSGTASASTRNAFQMGVDPQVTFEGKRSLTVKALNPVSDVEYVSAIQYVNSQGYEGKRVRFSGVLKSQGITQWAGVWLAPREVTSFVDRSDSAMRGRTPMDPLPAGNGVGSGDKDWHQVTVVIDVPQEPTRLSMGLGLVGNGQAWLSDLKFEEVDAATPLTPGTVGLNLNRVAEEFQKALKGPLAAPKVPVKKAPHNLALDI